MAVALPLVNLVHERLAQWRVDGYPGATRTTLELLNYWRRDGRQHRLFFAQLGFAMARKVSDVRNILDRQ